MIRTPGTSSIQRTLDVDSPDYSDFENFIEDNNRQSVELLKDFIAGNIAQNMCYLWGAFGTGKTHLLYAACNSIDRSAYVSLRNLDLAPEVLDELHIFDLVCIDDVHSIANQFEWERRLMALFERLDHHGNLLIVSSAVPPQELKFCLRDLNNRFSGKQILKLVKLSESNIADVFTNRANQKGLTIEDSVVQFVMKRYSHDLHSLIRLLNRIGQLSLEEKRNITIPFLKKQDVFK